MSFGQARTHKLIQNSLQFDEESGEICQAITSSTDASAQTNYLLRLQLKRGEGLIFEGTVIIANGSSSTTVLSTLNDLLILTLARDSCFTTLQITKCCPFAFSKKCNVSAGSHIRSELPDYLTQIAVHSRVQ